MDGCELQVQQCHAVMPGDALSGDAAAPGTAAAPGDALSGDAAPFGTAAAPGNASSEDAAAPGDASSGDAAPFGTAAVPGDASSGDAAASGTAAAPGDAVSGEAEGLLESAGSAVVAAICGRALVQELSLLSVLPLLIRLASGVPPIDSSADAVLGAACKAS